MLFGCYVIIFSSIALVYGEDDKKWVWRDNNRSGRENTEAKASSRYEVFEGGNPFLSHPERPEYFERPGLNKPLGGGSYQRPGGVYGNYRPRPGASGYGDGNFGSFSEESGEPAILTGPVPSWVQQGSFKEFDACKCTERFNCNTPGISYGHCDTGKRYCCYSKNKNALGGPPPSRPIHSPENGVLAGPGGPVDRPYGRPGRPNRPFDNSGYHRPGAFLQKPSGGFGLTGGNGPIHSSENGVLVGPGGPYDVGGYGSFSNYERSAKKA